MFNVSNVLEYIETIEELGIGNYIYRENNEPYYGIAMNLKDFFYSPLTALLFSCQDNEEPDLFLSEFFDEIFVGTMMNDSTEEQKLIKSLVNHIEKSEVSKSTQVCMLNKNRFVDISDIVLSLGQRSLAESIYEDGEIRLQLMYKLTKLFIDKEYSSSEISECLMQLIECYRANHVDFWGESYSEEKEKELQKEGLETLFSFKRRLSEENLEDVILDLYCFVYEEMDDVRIPSESDIFDYYPEDADVRQLAAVTYILLLANLIQIFHSGSEGLGELHLNLKICFTYQTAPFSSDCVYDDNLLCVQHAAPDEMIEIENNETILEELDALGFRAVSACDGSTHIAKFVNN